MGGPPRRPVAVNGDAAGAAPQKPAEVDVDIDFGGLSLQAFAAEAAPEQRQPNPVHTYSTQSVEECTCSHAVLKSFAHRACRRQGERQV